MWYKFKTQTQALLYFQGNLGKCSQAHGVIYHTLQVP